MRKILGLIGIMGLIGLLPIEPILYNNSIQAQTTDTNNLLLRVDGYMFFVDDEYFGNRIEGYTLPGFRLTPKVIWNNNQHLSLEGGVSWLHYWGAHSYPNTISYSVLPDHSDTSSSMHLVPWLQARLILSDGVVLTFGSIDPSETHLLPLPLKNPERELAADPECGLMLDALNNWGQANLWIDWREFIWNNSPRQERFTMGASGKIHFAMPATDFIISIPAHFIAQHVGGQVLAQTTPIQNHFNAAAGMGIAYLPANHWNISLTGYAMWYHQHGAAVPFSHGWGLYPELTAEYNHRFGLQLSLWQGERFVPLMGSGLYSNLSTVDGTTVFERTGMLSLRTYYKWNPEREPFCLHLEGSAHYDIGERQMQFAIRCALNFYPHIRLH